MVHKSRNLIWSRLTAMLLCVAFVLGATVYPGSSAVETSGEISFFFVNNLQGTVTVEFKNPSASTAVVCIENLDTGELCLDEMHSLQNGRLYLSDIPLTVEHPSGAFIPSEGKFKLTIDDQKNEYTRMFSYLSADYQETFPTLTQAQIKEKLSSLTSSGHPFLFGRAADFNALSAKILNESDEYLTKSYNEIKKKASQYIGVDPKPITNTTSSSYISRGFEGWEIVMLCSFVYLMEGDEQYAERAYSEAEYFASMDTWGTHQHIDNNQLAFAVALCYDWLYNWLDTTQRATLSNALKTKHLDTLRDMYLNPTDSKYQITLYLHYFGASNHTVLDNSSVVIQALALADLDKDYSADLIHGALKNLNAPIATLAPDSIWQEGSGYWTFSGPFIARMLSALDSSIGTAFGYEDMPTIANFGYFPIYQQSSQGRFIYSDNGEGVDQTPERFYFAELCGDEAMQSYCLETSTPSPLLCLWYDSDKTYPSSDAFQKDMLYRSGDTVSMRSTWGSDNELFAAMAVSPASRGGAYQNLGSFIIDALGEQWIKNPGRDSYSLPQYYLKTEDSPRWTYYCTRAEANSCVVINPSKSGGQDIKSTDIINGFNSGIYNAYAYADLDEAYSGQVDSYKRGLQMYDNRSKVWLRDEIKLTEPSEVYSFINVYKSDITLLPGGDGAILSKGDKKMLVKIFCDLEYQLSVMDAAPLPTSPNPAGQTDWTVNLQKLAIHFTDASETYIDVVFVPYYGDAVPYVEAPVGTIDEWSIAESEEMFPTLDSITVDGVPLSNFSADVNYYTATSSSFEPEIEAISTNGTVSVTKEGSYYRITVISPSGKVNHYYLTVQIKGSVTADTVVGGSWSGSDYLVRNNYGSNTEIFMRDLSQWSIISYYKLDVGKVPEGKKIKKVTLRLNGYRQSGSNRAENLAFYLVNPDIWEENTLTHQNAPIRHYYPYDGGNRSWFPLQKLVNGEYVDVDYDVLLSHTFKNTISKEAAASEEHYAVEELDLTELYKKNNGGEVLSFVMAIPGVPAGTNALLHFASKENPNENYRPEVYIELEDEACSKTPKLTYGAADDLTTYDTCEVKYTAKAGDELRAVGYVHNGEDLPQSGAMYVAQYDEEGRVLDVEVKGYSALPAGTGKNLVSDKFTVKSRAYEIKCFVWDGELKPLAVVGKTKIY